MIKFMMLSLMVLPLIACGGSSSDTEISKSTIGDKTLNPPPQTVPPKVTPPKTRDYIGFESAPVRPIAQSKDGKKLFITNTSNNSLEIYLVSDNGHLTHQQSLPVGLEPVAVAVREEEVWVVNHLSDSISIIDVSMISIVIIIIISITISCIIININIMCLLLLLL